jgi:hypothetical protein
MQQEATRLERDELIPAKIRRAWPLAASRDRCRVTHWRVIALSHSLPGSSTRAHGDR